MREKEANKAVSVIIPVYQVENYIKNCIRSVIDQSCKDFEIILVDDGSQDRSSAIAAEMLENADITYTLVKQENRGQGIARNTGLRMAKGEWVFFLDSDDVILPHTIERLLKAAEENEPADMVFCDFQCVSENELLKERERSARYTVFDNDAIMRAFLRRSEKILLPGTLYRKSFLERHHILHKAIRWSEDQYFIWQILNHANKVVKVNETLYLYILHESSIMSSTPIDVICKSFDVFRELEIDNKQVKKYLLSRWVLGSLHSAAKIHSYENWAALAGYTAYKKHLRKLLTFPSVPVVVIALFGLLVPPKVFYRRLSKT